MKPLERLNNVYPEELVLVHEAGHVVVGHARNLREGGIEFLVNNPYEVARAHWQQLGVSTDDKVIRALAGIYIQAQLLPESVDANLRSHLNSDGVTTSNLPTFSALMTENRCAGDWHMINMALDGENLSEGNRALALNRCLSELRRVVSEKSLINTAQLVADDIKRWLDTEDEDIPYATLIIYPMTRSRDVFAQTQNCAGR